MISVLIPVAIAPPSRGANTAAPIAKGRLKLRIFCAIAATPIARINRQFLEQVGVRDSPYGPKSTLGSSRSRENRDHESDPRDAARRMDGCYRHCFPRPR